MNHSTKEKNNTQESQNLHEMHRSRMRTRFCTTGADSLQDHELLEVLLYYALPRRDTNALAHEMLKRFGRLDKLFNASLEELIQINGIGERTAILLKTVFECHRRIENTVGPEQELQLYDQIGEYLVKMYTGTQVEQMILLILDKKGHIVRTIQISEGTLDMVAVNKRKIVSCSLSASATFVVLAHNHPSGILVPSFEDKSITMELDELLKTLDIVLLDHFIIADGRYLGIKRELFKDSLYTGI